MKLGRQIAAQHNESGPPLLVAAAGFFIFVAD
jgi:hypothetical protein